MASFDNFIKNSINTTKAEIPDNLSWDNMKAGIMEGVDLPSKKPKKVPLFRMIGIAVLLLGITGFFVCKAIKIDRPINDIKQTENLVQNNLTSESVIKNQPIELENNILSETSSTMLSDKLNNSTSNEMAENKTNYEKSTLSSHGVGDANHAMENHETQNLQANKVTTINTTTIITPEEHANNILTNKKLDVNNGQDKFYLDKLNAVTRNQLLMRQHTQIQWQPLSLSIMAPEIKSKNNAIGAYAGVNTWLHSKPQLDVDEARQNAETNISSSVIGLSYTRNLQNGWKLNTSIEYEALESRFNYQSIYDEPKLLKNQLTEIQINYISGDSHFVYADTVVNARSTRTVVHYNKHTLLNLPISIGKTISFNKFSIGLNAGAVINLYSESSGRTIADTRDIIDYLNGSNALHRKWKGVAFSTGIESSYQISNNMVIGISATGRKYVQNWYKADNGTLSPITLNAVIFSKFSF